MLVRLISYFLFSMAFISSSLTYSQDFDPLIFEDITSINEQLEEYFNEGKLEMIGTMYMPEAYIITPSTVVQGQDAIMNYWTSIKRPVKWKLEVLEVSQDESEIYNNEYYEALDTKPPGWRIRGVELDDDIYKVYQLGHSKLVTKDENGELHTSNVDFIIIWQVLASGEYKILLDTYTWQ